MMGELSPLAALELVCGEIFDRWDKDQRSGKLLTALSGHMAPGYDLRVDLIREALSRRPDAPSAGEVDSHRMQELEAAVSDAMDIVGWYGPDGAGLRLAMLDWSRRFEDLLPAPPQADGGE